jgi:hypothetical protein
MVSEKMYQLLPNELWSDQAIPAWLEMWTLAIGIYAVCKLITWWLGDGPAQPLALSAGYLIAWPGMDAKCFFAIPPSGVERPSVAEWLAALGKTLLGLGLLFGLVRLVPDRYPLLQAWLGMGGVVFTLHFGLFHLLSCGWRLLGIDAEPLMHWPMLSTSLTEFWSRRWNIAFRDLTYQLLFRPLTSRVGAAWALWLGFLASGVVHDIVVSLPAGGGYGLPTLYFLLQPALITLQRSRFGRAWGLGRGIRGWLFTGASLLLPAPLLFHQPFLRNVVIPFLTAMNAR